MDEFTGSPAVIESWLRETDEARLESLWRAADHIRRLRVGDEVHLRGLVEVSNYCRRMCAYCGLRAANQDVDRYRMRGEEILACARRAAGFGYGTLVMQAGEDTGITREWLADVIRAVKSETPLAVTLSMGERDDLELQTWRAAGADRYLLRFETSDPELYDRIHPAAPNGPDLNRVEILLRLRELGYETGSGVMVGVPGQSYAMLARDITLFKRLDLDMIGLGPYISHPDTPLGRQARPLAPGQQVPNTDAITYKALALTRLARPDANIPATTALATVNKTSGRELGLRRGANVVMPNLTPAQYRRLYAIYPDKAGAEAGTEAFHQALLDRLEAIGRRPGQGRGDRPGAPASTQFRHFK